MVIAVGSALALPALGPAIESVRIESATRRTAAFLDDARRRAVLERKVLEVRCLPRETRLELTGSAKGGATFLIPEGLSLVSCRPELVRYSPDGSATGIELQLRDRVGRERLLTVGSFTGLTRLGPPP